MMRSLTVLSLLVLLFLMISAPFIRGDESAASSPPSSSDTTSSPSSDSPASSDSSSSSESEGVYEKGPIDLQKMFPNAVILPTMYMDGHNPNQGNIPGVNTNIQAEQEDKGREPDSGDEVTVDFQDEKRLEQKKEEPKKEAQTEEPITTEEVKTEEVKITEEVKKETTTNNDKKTDASTGKSKQSTGKKVSNSKGTKDDTVQLVLAALASFVGGGGIMFIILKKVLFGETKAPQAPVNSDAKETTEESSTESMKESTEETEENEENEEPLVEEEPIKKPRRKSGSRKAD